MSKNSDRNKVVWRSIAFIIFIGLCMARGTSLGAEPGIASGLPPGDKAVSAGKGDVSGFPASEAFGADSMAMTSGDTPVDPGIAPNTEMSSVVPTSLIYSGAASHSIPIVVPPGRGNIAPNLSLTYNSYQKNSWLGEGWDLDLGSIQRSTTYGVDYSASAYVATMGGATSELVQRTDWGNDYYGAKIESAFSKYCLIPGGGWVVTAKDGTKYFYGSTPYSRQDNAFGVFKWCLDKVEDTNGNYMTISYAKDNGQIYLDRIDYTANGSLTPTNHVQFNRVTRDDREVSYKTKAKVVTTLRLDNIEVWANGVWGGGGWTNNGSLVRKYVLVYEQGTATGRSRIKTVTLQGTDNAPNSTLPPQTFSWQNGATGTFADAIPQSTTNTGNNAIAFGDIDGDGRTDFVKRDAVRFYSYLSDGLGGFTSVQSILTNAGLGGVYRFYLGDFNGDGRADLAVIYCGYGYPIPYQNSVVESSIYIYLAKTDGSGSFASGIQFVKNTYVDDDDSLKLARNYTVKFADINGDGLLDVIENLVKFNSTVGYTGYAVLTINNLNSGAAATQTTTAIATTTTAAPQYLYELAPTSSIILDPADFDGDGRADFILHDSDPANVNGFWLFLSKGDGTFKVPNPRVEIGADIREYSITVTDINGDGLADLAWPDIANTNPAKTRKNYTYFSNGNGFDSTLYDSGTNLLPVGDASYFADVNGDGLADLIIQNGTTVNVSLSQGNGTFGTAAPGRTISSGNLYVANLRGNGLADLVVHDSSTAALNSYLANVSTGNDLPDVLASISNGIGGTSTISYTSTSSPAVQNTRLPFVLHPVANITINDGLGNAMITSSSYSDGKFDFATREFRGFGNVTQTKPDGTIIKTWHHQDQARAGRAYQIEINEANSGSLISRTSMTWGTVPVNNSTFVKLSQTRGDYYDSSGSTFSQEDFTNYDTNGNLISATKTGTGVTASVTTTNTYINLDSWMWRLESTELKDGTSLLRKTTHNYYLVDEAAGKKGSLKEKISWWDINDTYVGDMTGDPKAVFTYDSYGNLKSVTDPLGRKTTTDYETTAHTYPVMVTMPTTKDKNGNDVSHAVGKTWNYLYGKPATETDENNQTVTYHYDKLGRLDNVLYPNGGQQTTEYFNNNLTPSNNNPSYTKVKTSEGNGSFITHYQFIDGLGRGIQTIASGEDGKSIVTHSFYDNMGRNWANGGPYFVTGAGTAYHPYNPADINQIPYTTIRFDNRSRPDLIESHDSSDGTPNTPLTTTVAYAGLKTTTTDPDLRQRSELKDYLGRLLTVTEYTEAGQQATNYAYNAAGDLRTVTNAMGNQTSINYDSLGRKLNMTDPDMGFWQYTYYLNGNLHTQTDAKGQVTTNTYDELNRLNRKVYSNIAAGTAATQPVDYTYDNTTPPAANGIGRLASISNGDVVTTYDEYDPMGKPKKVSKKMTIAGALTTYTSEYKYDVSGKLERIKYPGTAAYPTGYLVDYTYYPGSGLLHEVKGASHNPVYTYATFRDYKPSGQIGHVDYGNGTATDYSYDPQSLRLKVLQTENNFVTPPANILQSKSFEYYKSGDVKSILDQMSDTQYSYTYDSQHRLLNETSTNAPVVALGQNLVNTYDSNRPLHAVKSVVANGTTYSYGYDNNGNMTLGYDFSDPPLVDSRTFTYNAENMPVTINHARHGSTSILYDGEGRRAKKTSGNQSTYYLGGHFAVDTEYNNLTKTRYFIFAGNTRLAMVENDSDLYYFHKDQLGSSSVMTDGDAQFVGKVSYRPFGGDRNPSSPDTIAVTNYKYTDQEHDPETGLYNYNARLYDPATGMFTTADTIVPNFADPQSLNRYAYVRNNPLLYVDPSGHSWLSDWTGIHISIKIGGDSHFRIDTDQLASFAASAASFYVAGNFGGGLLNHAIAGSVSGGVSSAIQGGDVGMGMLTGGFSGGFAEFAGPYLPNNGFAEGLASRSLIGGITGGTTAEMYGGNFGDGFQQGAKTAAYGYIFNHEFHKTWEAAKKYLDKPYKYGASGPNEFDCSGLAWRALTDADHSFAKRFSTGTYTDTAVSAGEAVQGSLVVYYRGDTPYHMGFYDGKGNVLSAHGPDNHLKVDIERITDFGRNYKFYNH